jgi:hypothetical protein
MKTRKMKKHRSFGPRPKDDDLGRLCPGCSKPFKKGEYTTLVAIGPGDSEESRKRCREGRVYNAVAIEAHFACVTGEENERRG